MNEASTAAAAAPARIGARELKRWLHDGAEIALLDVREHGQYGEAHIFLCVSLPYSRLESDIQRLVPRIGTRIVIYDDGAEGVAPGLAERAAVRLTALGYEHVFILEGGAPAWREAGFQLFAGVNVRSKTFGEQAELSFHTPRISARELSDRLVRGDDLVVLDGRPVDEYRKMSIPTAVCCPNGELALRADLLAPNPSTTIVVNCAGRTRSIIGAQTLIDLGLPNPVFALENGTQGWFLEDLPLDHGADRFYPAPPADERLPELRRRALDFAARWQVPFVHADTVDTWLMDSGRTTYLCDVRTPEEFAAGSLPRAQSTPGGQLIQATDQFIGTCGARLVVFDSEGVRAPVIAARLRQMGWDAQVLVEGAAAHLSPLHERPLPLPLPLLRTVSADALAGMDGILLLDLRSSSAYRKGHLKGAVWTIRPLLASLALPSGMRVVLIADTAETARLAALDLAERGVHDPLLHVADSKAWAAAGLAVEATPVLPADSNCIDFLFFVHDRHQGNKEAARRYLAWETNLLSQIDSEEREAFRI
ncbi:rhodanese-like domain-containing protein [Bradyrhizobium sp. Arg237L]|uniref:rhodanese-like domain-containing protein n=1 Tax=Bradyrhizobium sp. Arg237L TaxID=3003352 RepID=UPI00249E6978|nr:rhodanese-like domain-containing protein [Bradyrhizobium sp. Arg237L]MDI4232577.1 rhodanese-like domain-containing protein [Bradyrhizobium sp. Arg237L]